MSEEVKQILADDAKLTQQTANVFAVFDLDKSGFIDNKELENALKTIAETNSFKPPSHEEITKTLNELDKNNDGKLNKDEFKTFVRELLIRVYL